MKSARTTASLPAAVPPLHLESAAVDGWHTFDYALLDFWYADKMLDVNGVVGFNDCGWRAVSKAIGFVLTPPPVCAMYDGGNP